MNWTMTQVIGHNARVRRDALGMTAAALGERVGAAFGKPWPRQTVYLMEAGERAMVAQEVLALSQILDVPLAQLFTPPADVDHVTAGSLSVPSESLAAEVVNDEHLTHLAQTLRALDKSRGELFALAQHQYVLIADAKNALLGKPPLDLSYDQETAHPAEMAAKWMMQGADKYYEEEEGESDGKGK